MTYLLTDAHCTIVIADTSRKREVCSGATQGSLTDQHVNTKQLSSSYVKLSLGALGAEELVGNLDTQRFSVYAAITGSKHFNATLVLPPVEYRRPEQRAAGGNLAPLGHSQAP